MSYQSYIIIEAAQVLLACYAVFMVIFIARVFIRKKKTPHQFSTAQRRKK